MNREVVLFHLREAAEQLNETIQGLTNETDYDIGDFRVQMSHLYQHLNTSWNGRDQSDEQFKKCTDEDFYQFRKFPTDEDLLLD
jgi:hypothetical protein